MAFLAASNESPYRWAESRPALPGAAFAATTAAPGSTRRGGGGGLPLPLGTQPPPQQLLPDVRVRGIEVIRQVCQPIPKPIDAAPPGPLRIHWYFCSSGIDS